jgi:alpha-D-ribose 1-methylphosphonate 5-triphosphate synthase subunit PhnL
MPILEVSGYSKQFHIHHLQREIAVFESLDFTLDAGEFLLVAGPNGIGKSTLLRCLYRSYRPTSGRALYHSAYGKIDLARAADIDIVVLRREEIGFVTQFLRPRPRVSALELVAEPLLDTVGEQPAMEQAEAILLDFGLKRELWQAYPATFSGGEQQKVNLARALIRPRRLLLLDEPTASLDAATRESLARRLADLKAQGVAMIGVFHHPEDVAHLIDDEVQLSSTSFSMNGISNGAANGAAYDVAE